MFWKYIFPLVFGIIIVLLIRHFVEFKTYDSRGYRKMPRVLVIVFLALCFMPILNYVIVCLGIAGLISAGVDGYDIKYIELKDNKFNNWLFKN